VRPGLHVGEDRDTSVTSCVVAITRPATSIHTKSRVESVPQRTTNKRSQVRDEHSSSDKRLRILEDFMSKQDINILLLRVVTT